MRQFGAKSDNLWKHYKLHKLAWCFVFGFVLFVGFFFVGSDSDRLHATSVHKA